MLTEAIKVSQIKGRRTGDCKAGAEYGGGPHARFHYAHMVEASDHGFLEKSNIQRNLIAAVEGVLSDDGDSKTDKAS